MARLKLKKTAAAGIIAVAACVPMPSCSLQSTATQKAPQGITINEELQHIKSQHRIPNAQIVKKPTEPPRVLFDHQEGMAFIGGSSSGMSAVIYPNAQNGADMAAYLINGVSNNGVWYQAGLIHYGSQELSTYYQLRISLYDGHKYVFRDIAPTGSMHRNDPVQIEMIFNGNKVVVTAIDLNNLASATAHAEAFGGTRFVFNNTAWYKQIVGKKGVFTGTLTEIYNYAPTEQMQENDVVYKLLFPKPSKASAFEDVERCNTPDGRHKSTMVFKNGTVLQPEPSRKGIVYECVKKFVKKISKTKDYVSAFKFKGSDVFIGAMLRDRSTVPQVMAVVTGSKR